MSALEAALFDTGDVDAELDLIDVGDDTGRVDDAPAGESPHRPSLTIPLS